MSPRFYGLLLLAALGMARACVVPAAHAQSDALLTARVCASETVPRAPVEVRHAECRQIAWATAERAVLHGLSYRAELRSYSPRATGRAPYVGREWVAALHPDRLPGVPGVDREALRWRFAALVMVATRALRGPNEPACLGLEWGAPSCVACRERMRTAGYVRAGCGLSNHWWREVRHEG